MTGGERSITSPPRLIASDLDGTLLRSDSTASGRTLDALLRARQAGTHVTRLCRRLGVAMAEVAAFGDMPNDLPMLRRAGRAWAVANAHPDVIAAAGETTLSNDEDGVAVILERFFNGR